jgi:dienelactone hydrolase
VNTVFAWRHVSPTSRVAVEYDPAQDPGFPKGMVVSEYAALRWSPDGQRLFLGIKEQEAEPPRSTEPQANVDVWHWKDPEPQSVQMIRINQDRRATFLSVLDLSSKKLTQLADSAMPTISITPAGVWGVGRLDAPYRIQNSWGWNNADYYRVNLKTGERTLIEKNLMRTMGTSPDSKWFLYLRDRHVHAYNLETGQNVIVDASAGRSFVDVDDDHAAEKPAYGVAGWTKDGASVLLYQKYDLWQLPLTANGKAVNLTHGVGDARQIQFRLVRFGAGGGRGGRGGGFGGGGGPESAIDLAQPQVLSAYGEWTKQSGYFTLAPGQAPAPLLYTDKQIGALQKADSADRVIFTEQTFQEFPDYWVSDTKFTAPRKVTDANPQLSEYAWGSKVLIDYTNSKGKRLQATLTLPAGYEPGKKYPMLVYFYEIMSNTHHTFSMPVYDDRPHMSEYASDGYLVLQPDVVYEIGKPGTSAVDCVTSAVKKVIALGYADPKHIGLQGHSWGGYQSSYIVTQTDMFAAVVTGAPPTNLISFYDELYKSTGTVQQGIMELGQVRMGDNVTPWTAHELYEEQSPVYNVRKIRTPFMILQGTADGAVDWDQGLEFFNAARRNGKQVIFLSYPDEPHHLAKKENQKDFQIRMKEFFDHYLKGTPAPHWMTDGVPQVHKGEPPTR